MITRFVTSIFFGFCIELKTCAYCWKNGENYLIRQNKQIWMNEWSSDLVDDRCEARRVGDVGKHIRLYACNVVIASQQTQTQQTTYRGIFVGAIRMIGRHVHCNIGVVVIRPTHQCCSDIYIPETVAWIGSTTSTAWESDDNRDCDVEKRREWSEAATLRAATSSAGPAAQPAHARAHRYASDIRRKLKTVCFSCCCDDDDVTCTQTNGHCVGVCRHEIAQLDQLDRQVNNHSQQNAIYCRLDRRASVLATTLALLTSIARYTHIHTHTPIFSISNRWRNEWDSSALPCCSPNRLDLLKR